MDTCAGCFGALGSLVAGQHGGGSCDARCRDCKCCHLPVKIAVEECDCGIEASSSFEAGRVGSPAFAATGGSASCRSWRSALGCEVAASSVLKGRSHSEEWAADGSAVCEVARCCGEALDRKQVFARRKIETASR